MEIPNAEIVCNYCSKAYKRKSAYKSHMLYCELLHKSKRELKKDAEDQEDAPSYKELCGVIKTLITKTNKLEKELVIIKKQLPKSTKNTVNLIDYLNQTITNPIQFNSWIDDLSLNNSHIDIILHNRYSYIDSIYEILYNILETNHNVVLKSFNGSNQIYIYEKGLWIEMNAANWKIIINKIVSESHKQYSKWKLNNINSHVSVEEQVIIILSNKSHNALYINVKKKLLAKIQEDVDI